MVRWLAAFALVTVAQGAINATVAAAAANPALVTGAFFVGYIAGVMTGAHRVPRAPRIAMVVACATIAVTALALELSSQLSWPLLRLVDGFAYGVVLVAMEHSALRSSRPERALAGYMLAFYAATGAGQLVLGSRLELAHFAVPAALAMALLPRTRETAPDAARTPIWPALFDPTLLPGVAIGGAVGAVYGIAYAHAPSWLMSGGDAGAAGLSMALLLAGGAAMQGPVAALAERFGPAPLVLAIGVLLPITAAVWIHSPGHLPAFAFGALAALPYPLTLAWLSRRLGAEASASASAALITAFALGCAVGPFVGRTMNALPAAALAVTAATLLLHTDRLRGLLRPGRMRLPGRTNAPVLVRGPPP